MQVIVVSYIKADYYIKCSTLFKHTHTLHLSLSQTKVQEGSKIYTEYQSITTEYQNINGHNQRKEVLKL